MPPRPAPTFALALLLAALAAPAHADWDEAAEARRAAQRAAATQKAAEQQRQNQALKTQAEAKGYRQMLGADAAGKSDAEVVQLGRARMAALSAQAGAAPRATLPRGAPRDAAAAQAHAERMLLPAGGKHKSLDELSNLSEAELEALVRRAGAQGAGR